MSKLNNTNRIKKDFISIVISSMALLASLSLKTNIFNFKKH